MSGPRNDPESGPYPWEAAAAAPPVEPPCAVCGDPKAKHDTDSTIAPHDYVPPSPDPVAGLPPRGSLTNYQRGYLDGFDAPANVEARALLAKPVPLPNHPDDGHPHSWGCRRCGVDPAEPVPLDVEGVADVCPTCGSRIGVETALDALRRYVIEQGVL